MDRAVGGTPAPGGPSRIGMVRLRGAAIASMFGEQKIREKDSLCFMIRSRHRLPFFIRRADLDSILGSEEGGFIDIIITNLPPSPIS